MSTILLKIQAFFVPLAHANQSWLDTYCQALHPGCGAGSAFIAQLAYRVADIVLDVIGGVATIMFLWGALQITISGFHEEGKNQGKQIITAAIVGIFLAVVGNAILDFVATFVGQNAH